KRKPGQQQQKRQQQQKSGPIMRRQQISDARDRISKLRKQQLLTQDARGRIQQRKLSNIKDARQLLIGKAKQQRQQPQLQTVKRQAASAGPLVVPKKVVANDLYRQRPAPPPQLEYEDDNSYRLMPAGGQAPRPRGGGVGVGAREIPVHVTRQRRDRSRSPVQRRAPPPAPPMPLPPAASSATIVQAYKVSIMNLHQGVTREDIYELFSSVGQVKKCVLLHPGAAEVVYPSKEDALSAIRRYDRRELDGMPMQLRLSVVGIKMHAPSAGSRPAVSGGGGGAAIDERAVRAALFRSSGGGDHRGSGGRPVNFKVSV
ncbi:hypothetical protein BOX15_Mlig005518g1, partial [Macrostomum lignano]